VSMRLRLDPTACSGHGLCADLLPERIELDEWGFPIILGDVPRSQIAHARRAVRACPTLALVLQRTRADQDGRESDIVSATVRRPPASRKAG
jgi:ferredoxin